MAFSFPFFSQHGSELPLLEPVVEAGDGLPAAEKEPLLWIQPEEVPGFPNPARPAEKTGGLAALAVQQSTSAPLAPPPPRRTRPGPRSRAPRTTCRGGGRRRGRRPRSRPRCPGRPGRRSGCRHRDRPCSRCPAEGCGTRSPSRRRRRPLYEWCNLRPASGRVQGGRHQGPKHSARGSKYPQNWANSHARRTRTSATRIRAGSRMTTATSS